MKGMRRLTFARRSSSSSLDPPPKERPKGLRDRSISEILDSHYSSSSTRNERDGFEKVVHYLGYIYIDDPKSAKEVNGAIKAVRLSTVTPYLVKIAERDGSFSVTNADGEKLLISPMHCIYDANKGKSECFAVAFISGRYAKQCHVFQARSSREVSG